MLTELLRRVLIGGLVTIWRAPQGAQSRLSSRGWTRAAEALGYQETWEQIVAFPRDRMRRREMR